MELYHVDSIEELVPVFRVANFAKTVYLVRIFAPWHVEVGIISTMSRVLRFWTYSVRVLASLHPSSLSMLPSSPSIKLNVYQRKKCLS
jgi:hypothetical protein